MAPTYLLSGDAAAGDALDNSPEAQGDRERQRLLRSVSTLGKFGTPAGQLQSADDAAEEEQLPASQQQQQQQQHSGDTPPSYTTSLPSPVKPAAVVSAVTSTTSRAAAKLKMLGASALRARGTPPLRSESTSPARSAAAATLSPLAHSPVRGNMTLPSPSLSASSSTTVLALGSSEIGAATSRDQGELIDRRGALCTADLTPILLFLSPPLLSALSLSLALIIIVTTTTTHTSLYPYAGCCLPLGCLLAFDCTFAVGPPDVRPHSSGSRRCLS